MGLKVEVKNVYCDFLPTSDAAIVNVSSGRKLIIRSFRLSNDSDVIRKMNLRVQRGSKYARLIPYDFRLCGRSMLADDDVHTLEAGDKIFASCDLANAVTCKISGVEETV